MAPRDQPSREDSKDSFGQLTERSNQAEKPSAQKRGGLFYLPATSA